MSGLTLYGIADELVAINDMLEESGGELTDAIEAALDALEGAFAAKAEAIVRLIQAETNQAKQRAGLAQPFKDEADRIFALAKVNESKADSLAKYLHRQMERLKMQRIETDWFKAWVQKNGRPSIQWTRDVRELPAIYRRETIEPDGTRIYEAWKAGAELPEGFKVEHGNHLRIR
jgi:hypothetical protein